MTKNILLTACLAAVSMLGPAQTTKADYEVVPLPQSILLQKGDGFLLTSGKTISCNTDDGKVRRDAQFLRDYIREYTGIELQIVDKKGDIQLSLDSKISSPEGYKLAVGKKRVTISGQTPAGIFYGIQTLRKSLSAQADTILLPSVIVTDAPRFGYRGMHLDCSRHFFPISFVKEYIDLLAMHNMNTFHWHLTDDQGWRIEIKKYPELTKIGSHRTRTVIGRNSGIYDNVPADGYYTQDEAREIVRYAAERYITVIPEVDMPGHMLGVLAAHPELGCTGGPYEVWPVWGVSEDVLCLGNEAIYPLLEDVIDELCDIFPAEYFHIGGDETPTTRWQHCPKCQALAKAQGLTPKTLQSYFTNRMEKYVEGKGRRVIGWDELMYSGKINKSATIMSWRGAGPGAEAATAGHDVIMTPNSHAYFDYYQTKNTWNEPLLIGGNLPIEKTYSFEPCDSSLPAEAARHILGVQANLWTEYIAWPSLAEYQVLPRMGALSEVQWMQPQKKNFEEFRHRAQCLKRLYDFYHLTYAPFLWRTGEEEVQQGW